MADNEAVVHIGENSPENIAYKLMHDIAYAEKKALLYQDDDDFEYADRKWILDTYAECLVAVKGYRRSETDRVETGTGMYFTDRPLQTRAEGSE